ncbi:hypothetical protein LZ30DRAFT_780037 [Colletotrichum cereale]|nr:hypothetical protein LZ30DRAFT_780037 [Colletotrichum cereale]
MGSSKMTPYLLCCLALLHQAAAVYFVNQLDGYDSLPLCAEPPVSSIVRDMVAGCGDGGRSTSYSCFCTASSDRFRDMIASSVARRCGGPGPEVASATSLFGAYCQLDKPDLATATTPEASTFTTSSTAALVSNTGAAAATPASSGSLVNAPSATSASSSDSSTPSSAGIPAGVVVAASACTSLVAVALCATGFLLWRRRQRAARGSSGSRSHARAYDGESKYPQGTGNHGTGVYEKAELEASSAVVDMPRPPNARTYELQ